MIAEGTPDDLKARVGGDVIEFQVADPVRLDEAVDAVTPIGTHAPTVDRDEAQVQVPVASPVGVITEVVRHLDGRDIRLRDLHIRRPTLDDVFLTLTGREADDVERETAEPATDRARRSR